MLNLINPCLWFDGRASEAAQFYCSVFNGAKIMSDTPLVAVFEAAGQKFMCLNGGPAFQLNPSISFFVVCETIDEVEQTWAMLLEEGSALMPLGQYDWSERYGWVQDKFGVNWQLSYGKIQEVGQKIVPTLMFTGTQQGRAEEAIQFYMSIFAESSLIGVLRYMSNEGGVEGTVKHAQFRLGKNIFMAMDSSYPHGFEFNEAISLVVECQSQEEIDFYWTQLSTDGQEGQCGWLKDKFGVSWQIVPAILGDLMSDPKKAQ